MEIVTIGAIPNIYYSWLTAKKFSLTLYDLIRDSNQNMNKKQRKGRNNNIRIIFTQNSGQMTDRRAIIKNQKQTNLCLFSNNFDNYLKLFEFIAENKQ